MQALATVALLTSLLGAGPPDAALVEAKAHVAAAKKAFVARKFSVALREFQEAQKLKPAPVLWFNIGKCYEKINEAPSALRAFRTYLREAPDTPDQKEVNAAIARMEAKLRARGVQQLLVLAQPPGATASIPGKGSLPVPATFELRPGAYTVTVSLNGHQTAQKQVTMTPKGSVQLELVLKPGSSVPMPPAPGGASPDDSPVPLVERQPPAETTQGTVTVAVRPNTPPAAKTDRPVQARPPPTALAPIIPESRKPLALETPPEPRGRTWTWVAGGVSLAGVGAGVGFGLSANSARAELLGGLHTEDQANTLYTRAKSSSLYANIGYGAAAAAGLAAIVLFLVESPPSGAQAMTSPSGGAPVVLSF